MIIGLGVAYYYVHLHPEVPPPGARAGCSTASCYNKWYFDELYDFLFVRPAFWIGRCSGRAATASSSTGWGPDGISARVLDVTRGAVRLQTGYVYHYAFAMLLGVVALRDLVHLFGGIR
jgi:NADH-quinone oxidoreductase subunit L